VPNERERALLIPMVILTVVILSIGLFPWIAVGLLKNVVVQFVPSLLPGQFAPLTGIFSAITIVLVAFVVLTALFYALRRSCSGTRGRRI